MQKRKFISLKISILLFLFLILSYTRCIDQTNVLLPQRGLCAHRGAMETHPENTLPSIREAIRAGAQMVELDVRLSRDGIPVLMHDTTVDRTTNGTGRVNELLLAELIALDAGNWFKPPYKGIRIPTLEEALLIFPDNVWIDLDMKGGYDLGVAVSKVVLAQKLNHQVVLSCKDWNTVKGALSVNPNVLINNAGSQETTKAHVDTTIVHKTDFIQLRGPFRDEIVVYTRKLHEQGIRVIYTCNPFSDEEVRKALEGGIDFPITNTIASTISVFRDSGFFH
jgi:glycerophosphoryl diester phosphodiesterase